MVDWFPDALVILHEWHRLREECQFFRNICRETVRATDRYRLLEISGIGVKCVNHHECNNRCVACPYEKLAKSEMGVSRVQVRLAGHAKKVLSRVRNSFVRDVSAEN